MPLWVGKILLHWCWGETLLVIPWSSGLRSGTASPLCPQHEGKQTGHHWSPAGSPCPFRHEKEQFTPLFWASTLNKYFSAGYKEIYLLRTILYVRNANKPIHSIPSTAHVSREGSVQMTFQNLLFFCLGTESGPKSPALCRSYNHLKKGFSIFKLSCALDDTGQ